MRLAILLPGFICTRLAQLVALSAGLLSTTTCVSAQGLGQTVEPPPAFEAASVKLSTSTAYTGQRGGPGQYEMLNVTLKILICSAYRVSDYSLSGPDWLDSDRWDVVAKLPASAAALSPADRNSMTNVMLQGLLAERFKLKVHREEKVFPGYVLVVAPGGPKMRRVEATQSRGAVMSGRITAKSVDLRQITSSAPAPCAGRCAT